MSVHTRLHLIHASRIVATLHRRRCVVPRRADVHRLLPNVADQIDQWVRWNA